MIQTPRINTHVLMHGPEDGIPVVFVHGNFSAATYWEETMLAMPDGYFSIAPDLRGYGLTEDLVIDGKRGARERFEGSVAGCHGLSSINSDKRFCFSKIIFPG